MSASLLNIIFFIQHKLPRIALNVTFYRILADDFTTWSPLLPAAEQ
jgi:hypothetical protein